MPFRQRRKCCQFSVHCFPGSLRSHSPCGCSWRSSQCLAILVELHQRVYITARGSYQINRGQDKLSFPGIAWEMGHQFIPALCSFQNGLSLSIEAQYFGCSMKSAKHERNPPVFSEMGTGLVAAPG